MILLYKCGKPAPESASSPVVAIPMHYVPWHGRPTASTLLRGQGATIIILQIIQCASGMPPVEILCTSIAVTLIPCFLWPGHPMENESLQLAGVARYQYGRRAKCSWYVYNVVTPAFLM